MNVFSHELKSKFKNLFFWSLGSVVFIIMSFGKFSALTQDPAASSQLMKSFSPTIQAVFGMSGLDLTKLMDYYGILFIYVAILLAVHAGLTGSSVLSEEERARTTEFLYVKPISRQKIIAQKILAGLLNLGILLLVTAVASWLTLVRFTKPESFHTDFFHFMLAYGIIQITFFSLGALFASLSTRPKLSTQLVSASVLTSYIIYVFIKLSERMNWLRQVSIFSQFDALTILRQGKLSASAILYCLILSILSLILTFLFYKRRDLKV